MISPDLPERRDVALDDDVVWNAIRLPDSNPVHAASSAALLPAICDPAEVQFTKQFLWRKLYKKLDHFNKTQKCWEMVYLLQCVSWIWTRLTWQG